MAQPVKNVLVCGGREYDDYARINHYLSVIAASNPSDGWRIVQGGARGADRLAKIWATCHGIACIEVPADWATHGKAAGPIRNQKMLDDHKPVLVLAFPGGRGTRDMVDRAEAVGVRVVVCT